MNPTRFAAYPILSPSRLLSVGRPIVLASKSTISFFFPSQIQEVSINRCVESSIQRRRRTAKVTLSRSLFAAMATASTPIYPNHELPATILGLPIELRMRIYSFLHVKPRITIQDEHDAIAHEAFSKAGTRIRPLLCGSGSGKFVHVIYEDCDWSYLLTCKTFYGEARHFLPQKLHLSILMTDFQIHHIPPPVRNLYLPLIPTLTIRCRYPVYSTRFDGSRLESLKTLYLLDEGCRSKFSEHDSCESPPPAEVLAVIQGAFDHLYIQRGMDKFKTSKMNWWQSGSPVWIYRVLNAESQTFQFVAQQHVFLYIQEIGVASTRPRLIILVGQWSTHDSLS